MRFNTILNQDALAGKENLSILKVNWDTPLEVEGGILGGLSTTNRALLVPKGKVSAYQASPTWSGFTEIYDDRAFFEFTVTGTTAVPTGSISKILYHNGTKSSAFTGNHSFPEAGKFYCLSASGVTSITNNVCQNCVTLTRVEINKLNKISNNAFANCTNLSKISFPSVTEMGENSFFECSGITNVDFSNVQLIGYQCFYGCNGLNNIIFYDVLTRLDQDCFRNCSNLKNVTINKSTPPSLGSGVFSGTHADLKIYVPADAVDTYKAASGWSTYASKIYPIA